MENVTIFLLDSMLIISNTLNGIVVRSSAYKTANSFIKSIYFALTQVMYKLPDKNANRIYY